MDEKRKMETWIERVDPQTAQDGAPLRRISDAVAAGAEADVALRDAVAAARDAGLSWAIIGATLGVTKQAAFQRFGVTLKAS